MEKDIQKINSGNESVNVQGNTVNITQNILNGLNENQVREISEQSALKVVTEYFTSGNNEAKKRMDDFADLFIPRLATIENALEIFKDPAFILIYRKAQIHAACSGELDDYQILTELLIHRFNKKGNKGSCIGINGAIDIVEQISDEALLGLTVISAILFGCSPFDPAISNGLEILDDLYSKLIGKLNLPINFDWLDQLDILKAIRLLPYSKITKLEDLYFQSMEGYILPGIKIGSENYDKALELLSSVGLNNVLIKNELLDNYVRVPVVSREKIERLQLNTVLGSFPLSKTQKDIIYQVYDLYDNDKTVKANAKKLFIEKFDSYPALKEIHKWWNSIPKSFEITIIGRVLGHANAKKCYPGFPSIDF